MYTLKNGETKTKEFSKIPTKSKRKPLKIEIDRGGESYNFFFQNFLNVKIIHLYSRFTDKGPSICERVIRTICSLLKKPSFFSSE